METTFQRKRLFLSFIFSIVLHLGIGYMIPEFEIELPLMKEGGLIEAQLLDYYAVESLGKGGKSKERDKNSSIKNTSSILAKRDSIIKSKASNLPDRVVEHSLPTSTLPSGVKFLIPQKLAPNLEEKKIGDTKIIENRDTSLKDEITERDSDIFKPKDISALSSYAPNGERDDLDPYLDITSNSRAYWIEKPVLNYPKWAEENSVEGETKLLLEVDIDSIVKNVKIEEKSGFPILDEEAKRWALSCKIKLLNNNGAPTNGKVRVVVPFKLLKK